MQLTQGAIDAANQNNRPLPGSAPQAADPFGGSSHGQRNGPFSGTKSMIDLIGRVPAEHSEAVAAAGHPVPANIRALVNAAQMAITRAPDVARQRIREAAQIAADDRVADEGKRRLLTESATGVGEQLAALHATATANIEMARAELQVAALPKLDAGREVFARADAGMRVNATPPGERTKLLMDLAKQNDDVAALVTGPYGISVLKSAGLDGQALQDAHRGIITAASASAIDSTDPARRAAAAHLRTLDALAGSADMVGVLARKSRSELRARHGLPDPEAIKAKALLPRRPRS